MGFDSRQQFSHSLLEQELITVLHVHVKYRMPRGFPSTSSLLLDYHVTRTHARTHTHTHTWVNQVCKLLLTNFISNYLPLLITLILYDYQITCLWIAIDAYAVLLSIAILRGQERHISDRNQYKPLLQNQGTPCSVCTTHKASGIWEPANRAR